jgi:H/ACA ribonucleoprotein complex subunit 2
MSDVENSKKSKKEKKHKKSKEVDESPAPASSHAPSNSSISSNPPSSSNPSSDAADESVGSLDRSKLNISIIAKPLANEKLTKKCLKLVKKAAKVKGLRRGVKEVVKAIRKGERGLMILAGNITPIDVITHLPVLCEENEIPYVFVPAKEELGAAGATKRPTSCVLIQNKKDADYADYIKEVKGAIEKMGNE